MKKEIRMMLILLVSIFMITGCTGEKSPAIKEITKEKSTNAQVKQKKGQETKTKEESIELTILAAVSLMDVTKELADKYKELEPNVTLTFSYGSSGALQTQIEEGAPADLFLSAATKQMEALEEKELLLNETKKELLLNKVVLITAKDSTLGLESFEEVGTNQVNTIALGEPEGVPAGQYAQEVFTSLQILDTVKQKANYASDVRQVLTWVESGEVDCGVVYATDAMTSDKVSIVCEAPEGSHKEIIYPVAVIKDSPYPKEAKAFLDFISTSEAKEIFEKYGFTMKE